MFTGIAAPAVIGKPARVSSIVIVVSLLNSFVLTAVVIGKLFAVRIHSNVGIETF